MPSARASYPATPSEDLAAWSRAPRTSSGILSAEMAEFCGSGVSVVVGARDSVGRAIAGRALGAGAEPGGAAHVILHRPANRPLLKAVEAGSPVAATFTQPHDHRSIQLKAERGAILDPTAEDLAAAAVQTATFRDVLVGLGYAPAFSALYGAYAPSELAVLSFVPEHAYVQTPGPGAGSKIVP